MGGELSPSAIKNATLPYGLFGYLANDQPKVARTHPPRLWADNLLAKLAQTQQAVLGRAGLHALVGASRAAMTTMATALSLLTASSRRSAGRGAGRERGPWREPGPASPLAW